MERYGNNRSKTQKESKWWRGNESRYGSKSESRSTNKNKVKYKIEVQVQSKIKVKVKNKML